MAKLLFGVHGLRGSLNNTAALAKQLVAEGHDVTVTAFRDVAVDVRDAGATFIHLSDGPDAAEEFAAHVRSRGRIRSLAWSRRTRRTLLELTQARDVLRDVAPDLAIIDMEMHGMVLAARAASMPTLLSIPWHDVFYARDRPPMHTELIPGRSRSRRLRIRLAWQQLFLRRRIHRFLRPLTREGIAARISPFQLNTPDRPTVRAMAAGLGLKLEDFASEKHWVEPHVYTHAPVLSFTSQALELDVGPPHGVVHVGPVINPDRPVSSAILGSVEEFMANATRRDRSIAYCSMGSLQAANLAYYQSVIAAFARLDGWALILGLGGQGDRDSLDDAHEDLLILEQAPQLQILDRAQVAIHPGGTGTFYECVKSATPSLVMHTGHVDMPGIAARVSHHHLGMHIDRHTATPDAIAAAIIKITTSETVAISLARHQQVLKGYEQERAAVRLVERELSRVNQRAR